MAIQGAAAVLKWIAATDDTTASWATLDNVRDVTLTVEAGTADVTTRANDGWRATIAGLREGTIEFDMVWEPGDTGFEAVKDAFLAGGTIGLAALDSDETSAEGLVGDFAITNFTRSEPLEEGVTVSVTANLSKFSDWTTSNVTDPV